jgi:hypothetical protein
VAQFGHATEVPLAGAVGIAVRVMLVVGVTAPLAHVLVVRDVVVPVVRVAALRAPLRVA